MKFEVNSKQLDATVMHEVEYMKLYANRIEPK